MYKFQDWLMIREESSVEGEIMRLKIIYPRARVNKIASMMREKGYNLGATEVRNVIKKWDSESPEANALRYDISNEQLNKMISFFLQKEPNSTTDRITDLLRNSGIFAEPWQVDAIVSKHRTPKPQPKQLYTPSAWQIDKPNYIPSQPKLTPSKPVDDELDYAPAKTGYFNQGTGGGIRVRRSTRYN